MAYFYFIVFLLLILCVWLEHRTNLKNSWKIAFLILTFMAVLRYGQGTDYFGYYSNYTFGDDHSEAGYQLICTVFKHFNLSFEYLVAFFALIDMFCIYRFINKHSRYKAISLLAFYPTIYLTYILSALRQGLTICFFLGFMLEWFYEKKRIRYVIACLILTSIHSAAILFLLLPLIRLISFKTMKKLVIIAAVIGVGLMVAPSSILSIVSIGSMSESLPVKSISVMGIAERIFMFYFIFRIWRCVPEDEEENKETVFLLNIYIVGFIFSLMFVSWSLMSSRLGAAYKAIEILLIPNFLYDIECETDRPGYRGMSMTSYNIFRLIFLLYIIVMSYKNINMNISQASYVCNVFQYPYISIFNKDQVYVWRTHTGYENILN